MSRAVDEWIGRDADTAIPDRVRVRTFQRCGGKCGQCTRPIRAGETWTLEHVIALINWRITDEQPHGNRESNLGVTCNNCLPDKNAADVAIKSETYAMARKNLLPRKPKGRPMPGTKASGWKQKIGGGWERRT